MRHPFELIEVRCARYVCATAIYRHLVDSAVHAGLSPQAKGTAKSQ